MDGAGAALDEREEDRRRARVSQGAPRGERGAAAFARLSARGEVAFTFAACGQRAADRLSRRVLRARAREGSREIGWGSRAPGSAAAIRDRIVEGSRGRRARVAARRGAASLVEVARVI